MLLKVLFIVVTITYHFVALLLSCYIKIKALTTLDVLSLVQEYFNVRNSVSIYWMCLI